MLKMLRPSAAARPRGAPVRRFLIENAGSTAVEFAFILPVMLVIYVYLVEFSRALEERRKVERLSTAIADLVSLQPTSTAIPSSVVASILGASAALTAPYSTQGLSATVSVISLASKSDGSCCNATVNWSFTQGGTLRPCNTILTQVWQSTDAAPSNIQAEIVRASSVGNQIVIADVYDPFVPIFSGLFPLFSAGFQRTTYLAPRGSGKLSLQSPASPGAGQQASICS